MRPLAPVAHNTYFPALPLSYATGTEQTFAVMTDKHPKTHQMDKWTRTKQPLQLAAKEAEISSICKSVASKAIATCRSLQSYELEVRYFPARKD